MSTRVDNSHLYAEFLDPSTPEMEAIKKTVAEWNRFVSSQSEEIFDSTECVLRRISQKLPGFFYRDNTQCLVVKNRQTNTIEAIALLRFSRQLPYSTDIQPPHGSEEMNCRIEWMATHPKNIKSPTNTDPVRGAGTTAIQTLQNFLSQSTSKILLSTLSEETIPFFQKLGFQATAGSDDMEWSA